jgi:hypothetical protein
VFHYPAVGGLFKSVRDRLLADVVVTCRRYLVQSGRRSANPNRLMVIARPHPS